MRHNPGIKIFLLSIVGLTFFFPPQVAATSEIPYYPKHIAAPNLSEKTYRVFILNSFNIGYRWTDNMLRGIDDAFSEAGLNIDSVVRFMDMKRISKTEAYFEQLSELLLMGYQDKSFDAVLACDNDALEFLRQYRDKLFPSVPLVFASINDFDEKMLDGRKDITGTSENTDYTSTIKIAIELRPKADEIVVVTDGTTTGLAHRSAVEKIAPLFINRTRFRYVSFSDYTLAEMGTHLSTLGQNSIVLLLHHFRDRNGLYYTIDQSTPFLTSKCPVPCFVLTDIRVGLGALGGMVVSGYQHGKDAAAMIVSILKGIPIESIPVMLQSPNRYMFDYRVMKRFDISETDLPENSIIVAKPESLFNRYWKEIIVLFCILVVLIVLLVIMAFEIHRRKQSEKALYESATRYHALFEQAGDGIFLLDTNANIITINESFADMHGFSIDEMLKLGIKGLDVEGTTPVPERLGRIMAGETLNFDVVHRHKNGHTFPLSVTANLITSGKEKSIIAIHRDLTERKKVEDALRESETQLRHFFESMTMGVVIYEAVDNGEDFAVVDMNPAGQRLSKVSLDEIRGKRLTQVFPGVMKMGLFTIFQNVWRTGHPGYLPFREYQDNRIHQWVENHVFRLPSRRIVAIYEDRTEKMRLEEGLRQAQKMESVGRLAGGVAHDFNNMLSVILGHTEMALENVNPGHPMHDDLIEIQDAARRSADLTRQLLAFARKQTITPKVISLNDAIDGMLKMLRRLIGEDNTILWLPGAKLWSVNVDPSQIDQILANLCVNAKDATSGMGKITLETKNVSLDEIYCADHTEGIPGDYVCLMVSDNGHGMDKATLKNLFEPFFTTKGIGKGTGLGLATVYGIVKQNNGFISVYSELEKGTTFNIYLPRHSEKAPPEDMESPMELLPRGQETILLVEDEPSVLTMTMKMLEHLGYSVLTAKSPAEAMELAKAQKGEIHLLMTDVIMPEMNGWDLAQKLLIQYPGLKYLFMSGYTTDVISPHGVFDRTINFIHKPFATKDLAVKLYAILRSKT